MRERPSVRESEWINGFSFNILYLQKGQMRIPEVFVSCQYARIALYCEQQNRSAAVPAQTPGRAPFDFRQHIAALCHSSPLRSSSPCKYSAGLQQAPVCLAESRLWLQKANHSGGKGVMWVCSQLYERGRVKTDSIIGEVWHTSSERSFTFGLKLWVEFNKILNICKHGQIVQNTIFKKMHLENRFNLFSYHAKFQGLLLIHFFMLSPLLHIVVHIWLKVVLIYFIVCFIVCFF